MRKYKYEIIAALLTPFILIPPHLVIKKFDMLLFERFVTGGAWVQIIALSLYAAFLVNKMKDVTAQKKWRVRAWTIFNIWFFTQLLLGIAMDSIFLLNDTLHFPIPAMIVAGPAYRWQIGFMPFLFLSTILVTGPAWCSQLCYWGAMDYHLSNKKKPTKHAIPNKRVIRTSFLFVVILVAILLRLLNASNYIASVCALSIGILGIGIMLFISRKQKKMVHCVAYCPVGTLTSYIKFINPFRIVINDTSCTNCTACTPSCRYDALNKENILNRKPDITCTYCGDCLSHCHASSIEYRFLGLQPKTARMLWITLTIALHAAFMGLGRI